VQRIFTSLACLATFLLAANLLLGLVGPNYNETFHAAAEAKRALADLERNRSAEPAELVAAREHRDATRAALDAVRRGWNGSTTHILLGSAAAVLTLLVNSLSITYFVGTSRWSKEVVETYRLNADWAEESARVKRKSFPWAVGGSLAVLGIVALGAASDPSGMNHAQSASWVLYHYLFALAGIGFIAWSFYQQGQCLWAHFALIERIMVEVRRMRQERQLPVEA
jgi:hypothetical protein